MNIDTLSIAKDLRAAELPSEQAEAIAAAIGRSVNEGSATKADLEMTKADLKANFKAEFAIIRTEFEKLRTEIERGRNQTLIWMIGALMTVGGIIIAVIKL